MAPASKTLGDEPLAGGGESGTVVFAVADVWPWAYEDDNGGPQGSLVEVANRLSELSGVPVECRIRPVRRAVKELQSGEAHFSILFQSPRQDSNAINVATVVRFNVMLTALADSSYPLNLDALADKRVAYIRGTYLGDAFEQNDSIQKVPINDVSQAIQLLTRGRISAILTSDHSLYRTTEVMGLPIHLLRSEKHVPGQLGVLYMSRESKRPGVAEKFRDAITEMSETGELKEIFFGKSGQPSPGGDAPQSPAQ